MKAKFFIIAFVLVFGCKKEDDVIKLKTGKYRAELKVDETLNLPFVFDVMSDNELKIFNAEEVIAVNNVKYENDSVYIQTPVFEGFIAAKIDDGALKGNFVQPELHRVVPFYAKKTILGLKLTKAVLDIISREIGKQYLVQILKKMLMWPKVFLSNMTI